MSSLNFIVLENAWSSVSASSVKLELWPEGFMDTLPSVGGRASGYETCHMDRRWDPCSRVDRTGHRPTHHRQGAWNHFKQYVQSDLVYPNSLIGTQ